MKKAAIAIVIGSLMGLSACQQQDVDPLKVEPQVLETEEQKQAYAFGANMGRFVYDFPGNQEGVDLSLDKTLILNGFIAGMQGQSQLDAEETQAILQNLQKKVQEIAQQKEAQESEANIEKGKAYLAENAKREGVTVTESGLQYEVLAQGEGEKPGAQDTVKVHYKGTLLDGTEFDSSYSRGEPATFPLHRVISGWTEGVQLMSVGSKYKFHIPPELAYGPRATGKITANSTLVFEVELLEIVSKAGAAVE